MKVSENRKTPTKAIIFILIGTISFFQISGCMSLDRKDGYLCVQMGQCDLPETSNTGASIIYVIRPVHFMNASENHYLYTSESGGAEEYLGQISSAVYCTLHTHSSRIRIRSEGGENDATLSLNIEKGYTYYLLYSVSFSSIFASKLTVNILEINKNEGEKYLRNDVMSKCLK